MELEYKEIIKERKEKDMALFVHTKNLITSNINEKEEFSNANNKFLIYSNGNSKKIKNGQTYTDFLSIKTFTKKQIIINNKSKKIKSNFIKNTISYLIISYVSILIYSIEIKQNYIYSYFSNITITIKGPGRKSIFSAGCGRTKFPDPKYIYINNILQETVSDKYDFNETENNIKLIWENKINNCNCLFQNCGNIIKIDFSNFDFSLGIIGNCMFLGCTSLTEIIFPSSRSIKVNDAGGKFYGCRSLVSLNISNFDFSSNWDFGFTFRDCEKLTSLDLSNFITSSSFIEISGMFQNCKNLDFLNLSIATFETADYLDNIFQGARNLVICNEFHK